MRHTWRNGYLKMAHCAFLMTSYFYSLIFCLFIYFLFALHLYFSVENRTSEGDFRRKLLKYFCIIRSDFTHGTPFFDKKKCAKMSVFLYENSKNPLAAGGFHPQTPGCGPSLPNPGCTTVWGREVKTLFFSLFINIARPCFKGLKKKWMLHVAHLNYG